MPCTNPATLHVAYFIAWLDHRLPLSHIGYLCIIMQSSHACSITCIPHHIFSGALVEAFSSEASILLVMTVFVISIIPTVVESALRAVQVMNQWPSPEPGSRRLVSSGYLSTTQYWANISFESLVNLCPQLLVVRHMAAVCTFPRASLIALKLVEWLLYDVHRYNKNPKAVASQTCS